MSAARASRRLDGCRDAAWVADGVLRLTVPVPIAPGSVQLYLLEDEPLTLIDCGPAWTVALDQLEHAMAAGGHRVEDLGRLIITHHHVDHAGLAGTLARRSGAEVVAFAPLAPYLRDYATQGVHDVDSAGALLRAHAVPLPLIGAACAGLAAAHAWGAPVRVTRPVADGDRLVSRERTLTVLHRPGHSPSDIALWDARGRILFGGDHLLARAPGVQLERPLGPGSGRRPQPLLDLLASLEATSRLGPCRVLPGHGEPITDPGALIGAQQSEHARRVELVLRLIDRRPRSGYELACAMWGAVAHTRTHMAVSDVLARADLLCDAGRASELADGPARFVAAQAPRRLPARRVRTAHAHPSAPSRPSLQSRG